jgi:hypothetical protein
MVTDAEWAEMSRNGEVCSMIGCEGKATTKCAICLMHICFQHLDIHKHITTDKELKDEREETKQLK